MRRKTVPEQDTSAFDRSLELDDDRSLAEVSKATGPANPSNRGHDGLGVAGGAPLTLDPALQGSQGAPGGEISRSTRESSTMNGNIAFNDLQNPSDALGIL